MKKLISMVCVLCVSMIALTSCDDSDDYGVKLPTYTDVVMTCNGQVVNPASVPVGQRINLMLTHERKAQNIYLFTYTWTCEPAVEGLNPQVRSNNCNDVPNGMTITSPGTYTLTIKVKYDFSGNDAPDVPDTSDKSLIDVAYDQPGYLWSYATIRKQFTAR